MSEKRKHKCLKQAMDELYVDAGDGWINRLQDDFVLAKSRGYDAPPELLMRALEIACKEPADG